MTGLAVRQRPWRAAALLAAVHVALALAAFDPTPFDGGDNAAYIGLAVSLLRRHAYLDIWNPLAPPHTQYPPVFPLILAAARVLGLRTWLGGKLVVVAFSGVAVACSYLWLRRWLPFRIAVGVGLVLALCPGVLELSHWTLSDVPFWAFAMLALWAAAGVDGTTPSPEPVLESGRAPSPEAGPPRALDLAHDRGPSPGSALWVTVIATTLAYFTRSAGLPLAVAVGVWLLWRRRWRSLGALVLVLGTPAVLWWLRSRANGGVHYLRQLLQVDPYQPALGTIGPGDLAARFGDNVASYVSIHLPVLLFGRTAPWLTVVSIGVLALAFVGWAIRARRPGIAELFLPLYLGLLLVWPAVWAGERFLLPALPVVLGFAAWALRVLARRAGRVVAVIAMLAFFALAYPRLFALVRNGTECTAAYRSGEPYPCLSEPFIPFFHMAGWVRDSIPADVAVLSRKPRLFWALSGHTGDIYPESKDPVAFFDRVRRTGARYLVVDALGDLTAFYVGPTLTGYPQGFCVEHLEADGGAALLRILPGAERLPGRVPPQPEEDFVDMPMCAAVGSPLGPPGA